MWSKTILVPVLEAMQEEMMQVQVWPEMWRMKLSSFSEKGKNSNIDEQSSCDVISCDVISCDVITAWYDQKNLSCSWSVSVPIQVQYQKEVERLEKENRELRKHLMLRGNRSGKKQKMRVCVSERSLPFCILDTGIATDSHSVWFCSSPPEISDRHVQWSVGWTGRLRL